MQEMVISLFAYTYMNITLLLNDTISVHVDCYRKAFDWEKVKILYKANTKKAKNCLEVWYFNQTLINGYS